MNCDVRACMIEPRAARKGFKPIQGSGFVIDVRQNCPQLRQVVHALMLLEA